MESSEEELKGSGERESRGICDGNIPVLLMDISKACVLEQPLVFTLSTLEVIEDFKTEKCQHMTYASKGSLDVLC